MNKICNNCGQELPDNATVCSLCNEPLNASSITSASNSNAQAITNKPDPAPTSIQPPPISARSHKTTASNNIPKKLTSTASSVMLALRRLSGKSKAIITAVFVVCIIIIIVASIGGRSALVGKWDYDMNASEGPPLLLSDSIEFASNGVLRYSQGYGFQDAGTWSVSKGKLTFDAGSGYSGSVEYSVRSNTLTLTGNYKIVYTKAR